MYVGTARGGALGVGVGDGVVGEEGVDRFGDVGDGVGIVGEGVDVCGLG